MNSVAYSTQIWQWLVQVGPQQDDNVLNVTPTVRSEIEKKNIDIKINGKTVVKNTRTLVVHYLESLKYNMYLVNVYEVIEKLLVVLQ